MVLKAKAGEVRTRIYIISGRVYLDLWIYRVRRLANRLGPLDKVVGGAGGLKGKEPSQQGGRCERVGLTKAGEDVLERGGLEGVGESDRGGVAVLADPISDDTGDVRCGLVT